MAGTVGIETLGPRTTMVADGLGWAEGPALMPDGSVCFVETYRSQVSIWRPDSGVERYSYTAGGPNACIVAADGALLVCQNGGTTGPWRAEERITPGIQRVPPGGGRAETILTEVDGNQLNGPNDLVFAPDGTLYFTDPGTYRPEDPEPSRIYAVSPSGQSRLFLELDPPTYPNGIAVDADGVVYWAESYTGLVRKVDDSGRVETLGRLPGDSPIADGLAVAANGDLYVTTVNGGGIDVLAPDGIVRGHLKCGSVPTNCVFVGDGLIMLTDAGTTANSAEPSMVGQLWLLDVGIDGAGTWFGPTT